MDGPWASRPVDRWFHLALRTDKTLRVENREQTSQALIARRRLVMEAAF
jgi:hypothetical protein